MSGASSKRKPAKFSGLQRFTCNIDRPNSVPKTLLRSQQLTTDGRRLKEKVVPVQPPPPLPKKSRILEAVRDSRGAQDDYGLDYGLGFGSFAVGGEYGLPALPESVLEDKEAKRKKRADASNKPMSEWLGLTKQFLAELMFHEGRGEDPVKTTCQACNTPCNELVRCRDCFSRRLLCASCMVHEHQGRPFDVVEKWNGFFFERTTLCKLGLVIQLGHTVGESCSVYQRSRAGFVVVDLEGIQEVSLQFCECKPTEVAGDKWQQLMRARLYPATVSEPHTAFTFRTLSYFHLLTTQGKVSLYDFYHTLEKRTDGSGLVDVKDRYEAFIRVMRQWRYLRLLQRAGIGNQPSRPLKDLGEGELAVRCPACPRPGVNMPKSYSELSKQFLYHKFISIDACFRLKRRTISSETKDPGLFTGLAYFVSQAAYQPWLNSVGDQKESSTCSALAAVEQANTKYSRGYATTGALLCICARHEMVEPTGMVDLKKGEKYGLSDYAVGSSQRHSDERLFRVLCYDIACQYHKRFFERMASLPEVARIGLHKDRWKFAVPKLHIQGHERQCQETFALHFLLGAGQTDGEGVERHWANLGPIGTSTREMGPGHRRDTIDDHMGAWNWAKVIGLGLLLRRRRRRAETEQKKQALELSEFSEGLDEEVIAGWRSQVEEWEQGLSRKNPYSVPRSGKTEQDVRLEYAEKEAQDQGLGIPILHEVTPSAFMKLALDIEEYQRQLIIDLKNQEFSTPNQKTELADRRSRISRAISRLRTIQQVYTPLALSWGTSQDTEADGGAETICLWLPSSLPDDVRKLPQLSSWVSMEVEFRRGQLISSLSGLCSHLFIRTRLHIHRSLHVRHQKASTRSRADLADNNGKIEAHKLKYRAAWNALKILVGEENVNARELRNEDITSFEEVDTRAYRNARKVLGKLRRRKQGEEDKEMPLIQPGESKKQISWIWKSINPTDDPEALTEAVRVEWVKTWARKRRWDEEVDLLLEEITRACASLRNDASRWRLLSTTDCALSGAEARAAYALRQASIRERLASRFKMIWDSPDPRARQQDVSTPQDGLSDEEEDVQPTGMSDEEDDFEEDCM